MYLVLHMCVHDNTSPIRTVGVTNLFKYTARFHEWNIPKMFPVFNEADAFSLILIKRLKRLTLDYHFHIVFCGFTIYTHICHSSLIQLYQIVQVQATHTSVFSLSRGGILSMITLCKHAQGMLS
jgi:hypothetical protein